MNGLMLDGILASMLVRPLTLCVLLLLPAPLLAERVTITADQWARPRSGETIARLGLLHRVVQELDAQPDRQIVIRHARGENGTLWAAELRSWLVSLGVSSKRISLATGLKDKSVIVVETTP
ncbi:MAG: hypothetical protein ACE5K1_02535 [Acidiferrobacterales bacterium]